MNIKKLNKKNIILTSAIAGALLLSVAGGIGYAKYITTIDGTTSPVSVAKWIFKVNNKTENDGLGTISLGEKTYTATTLAGNKLAPGTSGTIPVTIDSSNIETGLTYDITFSNVTNKPTNLYFKIGDATTKYYTMEELSTALSGQTINANENSKSVNINWAWDYTTTDRGTATLTQNDEIDTNEGESANAFSFKMAVKGTQVSPTEQ